MTLHAKLSDTASINDEVRLQLSGAFDADGVAAQRSTLEALADSPARRVVLDLSDVLSMDGSGIGALSFLFKRLTARRRKLVLNGVAGQPLAMIGELGLLRTLGIAESAIRVTTRRRRWFGRCRGSLTMRTPLLLLLLPLAACNTWPDPVGGGMAEVAKPAVRQDAPEVTRHLDCSLQSLTVLTQAAGQAGRVTGQIVTLETVAARAQREFYGRLPKDADRTLNILDREVAALGSALQIATVSARHCTA